ncbi:MAG: ATP-binding protein [Flexilinea sp.]|nr:ATP-binding protein [Flexilinea sp.]
MENNHIGYITGGSLKEGFTARLTVSPDMVQEGSFVVIEDGPRVFYGLVTNLKLCAADIRFTDAHTMNRFPPALREQVAAHTLYTEVEIMPALMQNIGYAPGTPGYDPFDKNIDPEPLPVKMVPPHHSPMRAAERFDVAAIFGSATDPKFFEVGSTREQGHPVAINMEKFVQRSSGIFGSTGTGKSYLTRMILAGLIRSKQASALVFDMHAEYAYGNVSPDTHAQVPGLKNKMPDRVKVCSLGTGGKVGGNHPDYDLMLEYSDVTPEDVQMLTRTLNLRDTTATTLFALEKSFGREHWLQSFMELKTGLGEGTVSDWAEQNNVNVAAAESLQSKLNRLYHNPYMVEKTPYNVVDQIVNALENGISVIITFGKYQSDLDYLLVANILTRKVRAVWEKRTEDHLAGIGTKPKPLVVAIEEAHKLLSRDMASQTAFALIAREMRKYSVTLLVIDQRPSQIDDEIMSQLGTRVSGWLGDETDIAAVLSGLSGKDALRGMLSRLQPKQEVLLLGYGVPMPLPIRSRLYDNEFWTQLLGNDRSKNALPDESDDWLSN